MPRRRRRHSTASYEQTATRTSAKKHPPFPVAYTTSFELDDIECIELENNNCYMIINRDSGFKYNHNGEPVRADYAREIESDGSLTIPSTELKHSGVYKAVAANSHGSEEREIKLMVNEEGGASTAVAVGNIVSSRPIPIPEFGEYVANLHANSNLPFKDLFQVRRRVIKLEEHPSDRSY